MVSRAQFYQSHLDEVSRSFAFCIARLEDPLRERVGLSYLLCRLLDTVEDAPWNNTTLQEEAFAAFDALLEEAARGSLRADFTARIHAWTGLVPTTIPGSERHLLNDAEIIFRDLSAWPSGARDPVHKTVLSMSRGMRHYMRRKAQEGRLVLKSGTEVNRYCFFVAGVVGELLTRLLAFQRGHEPSAAELDGSFRFGLFLQKVNLLKDQFGDEPEGRFLVPSRPLVLASLLSDADEAFDYLLKLPVAEKGFRVFCAWSLFLGLASLPFIEAAAQTGEAQKIPREQTLELLQQIEAHIDDAESLSTLYRVLRPESGPLAPDSDVLQDSDEESELLSLYRGQLSGPAVHDLFAGGPTPVR